MSRNDFKFTAHKEKKKNKALFGSFFPLDEEGPAKRLDLSRREIGRAASTSAFSLFLLLLLQHLAYLQRRWWRTTRRILALQIFQLLAAGEQIVLKMRIRTASSDYKRDSHRDQKGLKGSVSSRLTYLSCQWNRLKWGVLPSFIHSFCLHCFKKRNNTSLKQWRPKELCYLSVAQLGKLQPLSAFIWTLWCWFSFWHWSPCFPHLILFFSNMVSHQKLQQSPIGLYFQLSHCINYYTYILWKGDSSHTHRLLELSEWDSCNEEVN